MLGSNFAHGRLAVVSALDPRNDHLSHPGDQRPISASHTPVRSAAGNTSAADTVQHDLPTTLTLFIEIWSEVIQGPVDPDISFAGNGGDSLMAVHAARLMSSRFGEPFDYLDLLESESLTHIAKRSSGSPDASAGDIS